MHKTSRQLVHASTGIGLAGRIEDLTRRQFMSSALAAALLIACGDDGDDAAPEATTRIVVTPKGPVEIPTRPQRIVAIDANQSLPALDEVGAPLVAAGALAGGVRVFVSDAAKALPITSTGPDLDLEAIAAARPDLIVGWLSIGDESYSKLSAIAPTVLVDITNRGWRDVYREIVDAAGLADKMAEPLAKIETRIKDLETAVAKARPGGISVTVLRHTDPNLATIRTYTTFEPHRPSSAILGGLKGVTVTANSIPGAAVGKASFDISPERMRELDADVIFYYLGGGGSSADADQAALERVLLSHPLWPSLNAVKNGRAHRVDAAHWNTGYTFKGVNLVLDDLSKYLT